MENLIIGIVLLFLILAFFNIKLGKLKTKTPKVLKDLSKNSWGSKFLDKNNWIKILILSPLIILAIVTNLLWQLLSQIIKANLAFRKLK